MPIAFFNVSLPVEEISQAMQASLTTEPIPTDIMVDAPTSYHVVEVRWFKKRGDLLTYSLGFQDVKKQVTSISTSWICSFRIKKNRCFASVSLQGNTFTRCPKEHNHGGNPEAQLRHIFVREAIYKFSGKIVTDTPLTLGTNEV